MTMDDAYMLCYQCSNIDVYPEGTFNSVSNFLDLMKLTKDYFTMHDTYKPNDMTFMAINGRPRNEVKRECIRKLGGEEAVARVCNN